MKFIETHGERGGGIASNKRMLQRSLTQPDAVQEVGRWVREMDSDQSFPGVACRARAGVHRCNRVGSDRSSATLPGPEGVVVFRSSQQQSLKGLAGAGAGVSGDFFGASGQQQQTPAGRLGRARRRHCRRRHAAPARRKRQDQAKDEHQGSAEALAHASILSGRRSRSRGKPNGGHGNHGNDHNRECAAFPCRSPPG